jgi:hypothetical protein
MYLCLVYLQVQACTFNVGLVIEIRCYESYEIIELSLYCKYMCFNGKCKHAELIKLRQIYSFNV